MSEAEYPAPIFKPASSMSKAAHKRFTRWENWFLMKVLILYHTGSIGLVNAPDSYRRLYAAFYALHAGVLMAMEDEGGSILGSMPAMPDVWPEEFPFELARAFIGYLMELEGAGSGA